MFLEDIYPAIENLEKPLDKEDLRGVTYLATYPSIQSICKEIDEFELLHLHQVSAMTYGWMPRVLRLDPDYTDKALGAIQKAKTIDSGNFEHVNIGALSKCLHSVVGASKVLHFINPQVFPIWDSKIEWFRTQKVPSYNQMKKVSNYVTYVKEVQYILKEERFPDFYRGFSVALRKRLENNKIEPYKVSKVRSVELSAFELSHRLKKQ